MESSGSHIHHEPRPVVGRMLLRYSKKRHWSDETLAQFLGCDASGLAHLALARCPDVGQDEFEAWAIDLASQTGCIATRLVAILNTEGCTAR